MARPDTHYDFKREKLIELSLDLFTRKGYENTTITEIMQAAQLSKGGMYHYFSSKEEILDAVIEYGLQREITRIKESLSKLPTEEKLIFFIKDNDFSVFTQKLLHYKDNSYNSLVAYRIREKNISLCTPIISNIFEEGISAGIYDSQYPDAMAEIFMLLMKAVSEKHYLPATNSKRQQERLEASMQMFQKSLCPSASHLEKIRKAVVELFAKTGGSQNGMV